jgi:hypothetical protein
MQIFANEKKIGFSFGIVLTYSYLCTQALPLKPERRLAE